MYKLLCVLILGLCFSCQEQGEQKLSQADISAKRSQAADSLPPKAEEVKTSRLKLAFLGDIMQHGDQITAAYNAETGTYNYEPSFRYLSPLLNRVHYNIANLELTFNDKGNYTGYPRFRSPDTLGVFLKEAGFRHLLTANNHSNDGGLYGLLHTLDVLDSLGIEHTGTFRDSAERERLYPYLLTVAGEGPDSFRIVLLNYSYGTNGIPTKAPSVVNLIDTTAMKADIEKAFGLEPDIVIACMHWGGEYQLKEHKIQREPARFLASQGVDLIVGGHPHVPQPFRVDTVYDMRRGEYRPVHIAYSLGNLVSNQERPNTDLGLLWNVVLEKEAGARAQIAEQNYVLLWRHRRYKASKPVADWEHIVLPVAQFESDSLAQLEVSMDAQELKAMQTVSERIRKHLKKESAHIEELKNW